MQPVINLVRRGRATSAGRWLGDWIRAGHYRVGPPCGPIDRSISWIAAHDMVPADDRERSVSSLVDFFFGLVGLAETRLFIEAGAKDAVASIRAANLGDIECVVAFEANPYTYQRFERRVRSAGVEYVNAALTDEVGDATFFVRLNDTGSPQADGQASLLIRQGHEPGYERVAVEATTLDHFVGAVADSHDRIALWVDVEGASAQVLRGAVGLLVRTDVVMVEVEDRVRWEAQEWAHRHVVEFFEQHGLVPIARDAQSRHQYNVVFARPELIDSADAGVLMASWRAAR